jgi:hypothetical protein
MIDFLLRPEVALFLGVLGIVSIPMSVLQYYWSKSRPQLSCRWSGYKYVPSGLVESGFKISYNEIDIPRVTVTSVVIWNSGNAMLRGREIHEGDPLKCQLDDGANILYISKGECTRPQNGLKLIKGEDGTSAHIVFDYLEKRDGAEFGIVHTGDSPNFTVVGTMRGLPNGVVLQPFDEIPSLDNVRNRRLGDVARILVAGMICTFVITYISVRLGMLPGLTRTQALAIALSIVGLMSLGAFAAYKFSMRRSAQRKISSPPS